MSVQVLQKPTAERTYTKHTYEDKRWLWKSGSNLHNLDAEMDRLDYLTMPDYGLDNRGIKYFKVDSVVRGRGPNRLKYLDLEGRWHLDGKSIPYISAAFNHWERTNMAQDAFRDISDQPLNAIGMMGWKPSKMEPRPTVKKAWTPAKAPEPVPAPPESPREKLPHRSWGYGPDASTRRKLSVPGSRSPSASPRGGSPMPQYDIAGRYSRKESYGTRSGSQRDLGYSSAEEPGQHHRQQLQVDTAAGEFDRPPHRTQELSPNVIIPGTSPRKYYDTDYDASYLPTAAERHYANRARSVPVRQEPPVQQFNKNSTYHHAIDVMKQNEQRANAAKRELSPHRTQAVSPNVIAPGVESQRRYYDTDYDASYLNKNSELPYRQPSGRSRSPPNKYDHAVDTLKKRETEEMRYLPHRSVGYGNAHERRKPDYSPRPASSSSGVTGSDSQRSSPYKRSGAESGADNILVSSYHMSRLTSRHTEPYPPRRREITTWLD